MIVSINQPAYLPWLGYFHHISLSDLYIVLDHVQFEKNSFVNRNKVRTADGWCWLTVPVITKGKFGDLSLKTLEINNDVPWRKKHWNSIKNNYCKTPYFERYASFFEGIYRREWKYLTDLCDETNKFFLYEMGIRTPIKYSSDMNPKLTKNDLVLELCKNVGATTYYSGNLWQGYLDEKLFKNEGIDVIYQHYASPEYEDYKKRVSGLSLSVLDLLFNKGPRSIELLMHPRDSFSVYGENTDSKVVPTQDKIVHLREACADDAKLLWKWANDTDTRQNSFSPELISWEDHSEWFKKRLADTHCVIFIGMDEEYNPVGQMRFNRREDGDAEVDVHIAPGRRGRGYGKLLIKAAVKEFIERRGIPKIHAFIHHKNEASIRVFQNVGFVLEDNTKIKGVEVVHYTCSQL